MNAWLEQMFAAEAVDNGGIVRRSIDYVERIASLEELKYECEKRCFHLLEMGGQYVVICNDEEIQIHCGAWRYPEVTA